MIWILLGVALIVFVICDCIENCVESKYKWQEFNSCCSTCPMRYECKEMREMNKHTRSVSLIDGHTEEMTDAEVIKALECCITNDCAKCKAYDETNGEIVDCLHSICRNALDLINRQKAEIEKLNVELVGMRGACESYKIHYDNAQAEIERYKAEHKDFVRKLGDIHSMTIMVTDRKNEIKSEAIKEFAEKFKGKASSIVTSCQGYEIYETKQYQISAVDFDNLVKEMTEVSE